MYNLYFWLILTILVAGHLVGILLDRLNSSMWSDKIPDKLAGIVDQEEYSRSQNYYRENKKIGNIASTINLFAVILLLFFAGFAFVDSIARLISVNEIVITLLFFAIIGIATDIGHLPFNLYGTFVIEEKYGFNKTTPRIFISDHIKSWILMAVIGAPLLALITWIFNEMGEYFWILIWGVITLFSLFMNMFYSELIVPLFNKQKPLEEGELREAIEKMAIKAGFNLSNIYTIDGSKRSSKANAYFSGFGPRKRIVLFDTLSNDLSVSQIVAVLAHEIGHYKKKHTVFVLFAGIFQTGLMLYFFSLLSGNQNLAIALGTETVSFHISLLAFILVYSPVSLILSILMNYASRRQEFAADNFCAQVYDGKELASALKTLSVKNLSNLNPHPAFVSIYYSHPPLLERLKALEE
jgi:STE24 endopeptidase